MCFFSYLFIFVWTQGYLDYSKCHNPFLPLLFFPFIFHLQLTFFVTIDFVAQIVVDLATGSLFKLASVCFQHISLYFKHVLTFWHHKIFLTHLEYLVVSVIPDMSDMRNVSHARHLLILTSLIFDASLQIISLLIQNNVIAAVSCLSLPQTWQHPSLQGAVVPFGR